MPLRAASYDAIFAAAAHSKEDTMSDVHILAIDLAKRSFQVCGTDRGGACVDAPYIARFFFRLLLQRVASIGRVSGL
ncbi:transposase IS116/IS110/IS902 family protein [Nitratireductor aquibiodomus RA22]|uniref:Transposase IS116/IS110/IS902 family protein n=1 Tax=Nitratireductor aquibiodomus RA22 TaxID=1189611 RepID=I5C3Z1_9HYPH|nr:transposase IS116/IS110/IS902 family protein [Nitratireductor aquibiodomus RA22]